MDKDSRLLVERYKLVKESMSFWPTKTDPEDPKVHMGAFPAGITDPYHGQKWQDVEKQMYSGEFKPHDAYRPDLDMSLSNVNAIGVMRSLEPYLHLNSKRLKIPIKIHHEDYFYSLPIEVMIAACKSYLEAVVAKPEPAIPTYTEPRNWKKSADVIDFATGGRTPGSMHPVGPTMIHSGKPENYTKTAVMRILKIATEGKQHGAEFFAIG